MELVECHSGSAYAERPLALVWEDQRLEIEAVLAAWREPGERHFKVRTRGQRIFLLVYREADDVWQIKPM